MVFEQIHAGGDRDFGYLIGDEETKGAAVIDPSSVPASQRVQGFYVAQG
jgi:hypothetical protein